MQAGQQSHLGLSTVRCDHHCCKGGREDMGRGKDENKNESADQCRDNTQKSTLSKKGKNDDDQC